MYYNVGMKKYLTHLAYMRNGYPITAEAIVNFSGMRTRNGDGSCWIWRGSKTDVGYGRFSWRHEREKHRSDAHRFSWMIHRGEIPKRKMVCHSCDNKLCVNPDHFWIGTAKQNTHDMIKKGRMKVGNHSGEQNGMALLNWKQVAEIRKRFKKRIVTAQMLGDEFGVKKHVIHLIVQNKTWRNQ